MRLPVVCPPATLDLRLNLFNRQAAINGPTMYGPPNPALPNEEYWARLASVWGTSRAVAKTMRCGNCAFFDIRNQTLDCIAKGLGGSRADAYDSIRAGKLGYCKALQFKCAAARTCSAWVTGGPIR